MRASDRVEIETKRMRGRRVRAVPLLRLLGYYAVLIALGLLLIWLFPESRRAIAAPITEGGASITGRSSAMELATGDVGGLPPAGGETAAPFVGVQGFYLSSQSANALLANEFLVNYMGTEEAQRALYEADPRLPAFTSLAEEVSSDPIVAGFLASAQNGVPMPSMAETSLGWAAASASKASSTASHQWAGSCSDQPGLSESSGYCRSAVALTRRSGSRRTPRAELVPRSIPSVTAT